MDGSLGAAGSPDVHPGSPGSGSGPETGAWEGGLEILVAEVERTGREWGVRPDSLEGRFVSALLGTTKWLGRLGLSAQASFETLGRHNRDAAELELARAREITKAAQIALSQARNAQIVLEIEKENVVGRMIDKTLPLFIEKMQGVLVVREKRLNDDLRWRRYGIVGLVVLSLVLGGYALRAWEDDGATSALGECLAHPLQASGHLYCDVTGFAQPNR